MHCAMKLPSGDLCLLDRGASKSAFVTTAARGHTSAATATYNMDNVLCVWLHCLTGRVPEHFCNKEEKIAELECPARSSCVCRRERHRKEYSETKQSSTRGRGGPTFIPVPFRTATQLVRENAHSANCRELSDERQILGKGEGSQKYVQSFSEGGACLLVQQGISQSMVSARTLVVPVSVVTVPQVADQFGVCISVGTGQCAGVIHSSGPTR